MKTNKTHLSQVALSLLYRKTALSRVAATKVLLNENGCPHDEWKEVKWLLKEKLVVRKRIASAGTMCPLRQFTYLIVTERGVNEMKKYAKANKLSYPTVVSGVHKKYPYYDLDGRHRVGGELTGWMHFDAVIRVECPKCHEPAGYYCSTPAGAEAKSTHGERVTALANKVGTNVFKRKATTL